MNSTTTPSDAHDQRHPHPHPLTQSHPEEPKAAPPLLPLDEPTLTAALCQLPKESMYHIKGFISFTPPSTLTPVAADAGSESRPWWILNWAFGHWELVPAPSPIVGENDGDDCGVIRLTVMGEHGEVRWYAKRLAGALPCRLYDAMGRLTVLSYLHAVVL